METFYEITLYLHSNGASIVSGMCGEAKNRTVMEEESIDKLLRRLSLEANAAVSKAIGKFGGCLMEEGARNA